MSATRQAIDAIDAVVAGRFDDVVGRFAPSVRAMITPDALRAGWTTATVALGAYVGRGEPVEEPVAAEMVLVRVPVTFTGGALVAMVTVTGNGELAGLQLAPREELARAREDWQPPSYADTSAFVEHEVTLGSDPLAVPGTLSVPVGAGPWPSVVVLPGSGPTDRDSSIGPNKPLKDLAWGLASRGVAVLRFDKVTHAHPAEVVADRNFTALDEYRAATVAAVAQLRATEGIDPARIVLLGHSLGGTVAPRIAAGLPGLAGLVLFAAGAEPLYWAAIRQVRHIAELDPATAGQAEPVLATMTEQARRADDPALTADAPAASLPFGQPAPYWLDLRDHDPVEAAAALDLPMLVVNGGRDYQVTIADDLARWRAGLAGRAAVTFREYPADNHLFFPGDEPSAPAEYQRLQHVDGAVVADVADWVSSLA
jgi:dienelactone hydrolase